jgi:hypothetical protein
MLRISAYDLGSLLTLVFTFGVALGFYGERIAKNGWRAALTSMNRSQAHASLVGALGIGLGSLYFLLTAETIEADIINAVMAAGSVIVAIDAIVTLYRLRRAD